MTSLNQQAEAGSRHCRPVAIRARRNLTIISYRFQRRMPPSVPDRRLLVQPDGELGRGGPALVPRRWPSHACYNWLVAREITQRTLRNESGEIMRGLDRGESFVVTRNGVPVGELTPMRRRRFVSAEAVRSVLAGAPQLDPKRFREDVDRVIDQDAQPRA